jgi:hypothetical protein
LFSKHFNLFLDKLDFDEIQMTDSLKKCLKEIKAYLGFNIRNEHKQKLLLYSEIASSSSK